ncbi:MAG: T9SS type A sorting domain-containing protein [Bacteroidales bacterium]|nr:T9SS type A sorting domain-containing protein [Bacteroidales bacterium]
MKKLSLLILGVLLCTRIAFAQTYESFEIFENFDDASHFTEGSIVPDGWSSIGTSPAERMEAGVYMTGYAAHSGSYVLHSSDNISVVRDEVIFTPMMELAGGKDAVLSFYIYAPGGSPAAFYSYVEVKAGTAQNMEAQTIALGSTSSAISSWSELAFLFTPATDGEYCFSISLKQSSELVRDHGLIGIDDVTITGYTNVGSGDEGGDEEEDELNPNPNNYVSAMPVPYYNTFDNYDGDYNGSTYLPKGWLSVGNMPFFTANINGVDAVTGTYYLVAEQSDMNNRNDILFTPFFRLSAGEEYVISYYLYMPGNSGGGVLRATNLTVTVGTEHDILYHPVIKQNIEDQSISEWQYQEFTFAPQVSGAYCFGFSLSTYVNYSGLVAIEDFNITIPGYVGVPFAEFGIGGNFNVIDSRMVVYKNQYVHLTNLSKNCDEYLWVVTSPTGAVQHSAEENPSFLFNESGEYTIELTASNSEDSRTTSKTIMVEYIDYDTEDYTLMTWNPTHDQILERGSIPAFSANGIEDYDYDYVTGYTRYYKKYAERFEIPSNVKLEISVINTWLAHYRNRAYTTGSDSDKPFEVVFYGETNGQLDEDKVFARISMTLKDAFGTTGIGSGAGEGRSINLVDFYGKPVEVEGTFYVAFEFADDMTVSTEDPNIGRSYIALNTIKHATQNATLYVKPTSVPANSQVEADGNWYPVDMLDNKMSGVGAYIILWVANEISGDDDDDDDDDQELNPSVEITLGEVTTTSLKATFTPNADCAKYHILADTQANMEMWMTMMGASLEDLVVMWGVEKSSAYTHTWNDLAPNTEYTVYALPKDADGNAGELVTTTVTTEQSGGTGTSVIELVVEVLTKTSVKTTATPNEETAVYHYGLIEKSYFDEIGEEAAIQLFREDFYSFYEVDVWEWIDLTPETDYYAIATGQNSAGEWGETTIVAFRTEVEGFDELVKTNFSIYPNPASSTINIVSEVKGTAKIFDMTSRCVKEVQIEGVNTTINIEDLNKGVYFISVNESVKKLVVK